MGLKVGDTAPDFTLPDEHGNHFRLQEALKERLLLVFYPGDNTPVCTAQLCDYRDGIEQFTDLGIRVIGISKDDAVSHQAFKKKHKLPFTLLSDTEFEVAEHYECKSLLGMKRGVYVIDTNGSILYRHVETVAVFRRQRNEIIKALQSAA